MYTCQTGLKQKVLLNWKIKIYESINANQITPGMLPAKLLLNVRNFFILNVFAKFP